MRRTEVRPICRRLAISDLLIPARCNFWISAACRAAVSGRPDVCHSAAPVPNQRGCVPAKSLFLTQRKSLAGQPSLDRLASSDPVLRSAKRSRHRDDSVPEVWPADLSLTGPSDPNAIPARRRFPVAAPLPSIFLVPPASPHRSQPHALAERLSNHGERCTPGWPGSASPEFAGHWWKRGHTEPHETFSPFCVHRQKPYLILTSGRPVLSAFGDVCSAWPQSILFGQAANMILRGWGCGEPQQCLTVIPGHPVCRVAFQFVSVTLQFGEVVEWIGPVEFARVDETHIEITHHGTVWSLVKQRILAVQNGLFQGALAKMLLSRVRPSREETMSALASGSADRRSLCPIRS
jgi:hypothetical protein